MKRTQSLILSAAFALPLCLSAQTWGTDFPATDRNGDGIVSRSEWRGNNRTFNQHDSNRDGVLSGNELPGYVDDRDRYRDQTRNRPQARGGGGGVGKLDQNRTGRVEGHEWPYNQQLFHKLDTDADSTLSADELRNIETATMDELDMNRNRRIDPDEWPGGFAKFEQLDQDKDGRVTSREYFDRGGAWQRRDRFDSWDTNKDGVIQSHEWKTAPAMFRRMDTTRNSKIEFDVFQAVAFVPLVR
jgi:Ca2+-binding EF-hand superfamily protein